jgi:hypothetical protein
VTGPQADWTTPVPKKRKGGKKKGEKKGEEI